MKQKLKNKIWEKNQNWFHVYDSLKMDGSKLKNCFHVGNSILEISGVNLKSGSWLPD